MGAVAVWLRLAALVFRYASLCGSSGSFSSTQLDICFDVLRIKPEFVFNVHNYTCAYLFLVFFFFFWAGGGGGGGGATGLKDKKFKKSLPLCLCLSVYLLLSLFLSLSLFKSAYN